MVLVQSNNSRPRRATTIKNNARKLILSDSESNSSENENENENVSMDITSDYENDDFLNSGSYTPTNDKKTNNNNQVNNKRNSTTPLSAVVERSNKSLYGRKHTPLNGQNVKVTSSNYNTSTVKKSKGRRESTGSAISRISVYSTPNKNSSPFQPYSDKKRSNERRISIGSDFNSRLDNNSKYRNDRSVSPSSHSSSVRRLRRTSELFETIGSPFNDYDERRKSLLDETFNSPTVKYSLSDTRNKTINRKKSSSSDKLDLSTEELRNSFDAWMKIAADNKITTNNTWNLALIDYFHDMTVLRDGDQINFQKASCTLDGCVKIYTSRIDSVDMETKKLLSGLISTNDDEENQVDLDPENNNNDDDDEGDNERKRKQRVRASRSTQTLESDITNLDFKKLDLEFMVDPLFKKTSIDFDEGGARGLLLNHLSIDNKGKIIFDSSDFAEDQQIVPEIENDDDDHNDDDDQNEKKENMSDSGSVVGKATIIKSEPTINLSMSYNLKSEFINTEKLLARFGSLFQVVPSNDIKEDHENDVPCERMRSILSTAFLCGPLKTFEFNSNSLDIGGEENVDDDFNLKAHIVSDSMFDNFRTLNIIESDLSDNTNNNNVLMNMADDDDGFIDYDMNSDIGADGLPENLDGEKTTVVLGEHSSASQAGSGNSAIDLIFGKDKDARKMAYPRDEDILEMLGTGFKENQNIFNYFNNKFTWGGHAFWKTKRNNVNKNNEENSEQAQKKKPKKQQIVPNFFDNEELDIVQLENSAPQAPILLPESKLYNLENKNLLGERKQFSAKDILSLFLKPGKPLRFVRKDGSYAEVDVNQEIDEDFIEDFQGELDPQDKVANIFDNDHGDGDEDEDRDFAGFGYDDDDQYYASQHENTLITATDSGPTDYGSQFVEKPKTTNSIPLNFARVAKRVDVKKLKKNIWKDLVGKLTLDLNKENDGKDKNGDDYDGERDDDNDVEELKKKSLDDFTMPKDSERHLTEIVEDLDEIYPDRARKDISVAFCFICVLHLANDHGLEVKSNETMNDLSINQNH